MKPLPTTPAKGGHRSGIPLPSGTGPRKASGAPKPLTQAPTKNNGMGPNA